MSASLREAQALESRGDYAGAARMYELAFSEGVVGRDLELAADALRGNGRTCRFQGRLEAAEEYAHLSCEIAERSGLFRAAARGIHMVAAIRHDGGDYAGARQLYRQALERARDCGDDELIAFTCQNLGVLTNIEGDLREARALYLESIGAAVRARNRTSAMMSYNNLGLVCAHLGEWLEAEVYYDRGIEIGEGKWNVHVLARLHLNRAEPLLHAGDQAGALESLTRAEEIASGTGDERVLTDVARFRAAAARLRGDFAAAERLLESGFRRAGDSLAIERAELLRERARLERARGATDAAFALLAQALGAFEALGAGHEAKRSQDLLKSWTASVALTAPAPSPRSA